MVYTYVIISTLDSSLYSPFRAGAVISGGKMGILKTLFEVKMSLSDTFCLGREKTNQRNQKLILEDHRAVGTISAVKTCWWIKINTKHVRMHALDGAKFPHIIYFTYDVNGIAYQGCSCISYYLRCPNKGETITVFYDKDDPARYAVRLPGSRL